MLEVPDNVAISFFTTYARGQKSSNVYRTRCMICGDSQKKKHIKRLFLIKKNGNWYLHCHNCDYGASFIRFVKEEFSEHYDSILNQCRDYSHIFENKSEEKIPEKVKFTAQKNVENPVEKFIRENCIPLSPNCGEPRRQKIVNEQLRMLLKRKIKTKIINKMYYCIGNEDDRYEDRVIIPFFNNKGEIYYFQAKSIFDHQDPKYKNWKIKDSDEDNQKPEYNEHHVDTSKIVYIIEGLIDSTFIRNAVSILGVQMSDERYEYFCEKYPNHVFILDNDPDGWRHTRWLFEKKDERCVLFPFEYKNKIKDLNELALHLNMNDLTDFAEKHTHKGLIGSMKMDEFKIAHINKGKGKFNSSKMRSENPWVI